MRQQPFYGYSPTVGMLRRKHPPGLFTVASLNLRDNYNIGLLNVLKHVKDEINPEYQQYLTDISAFCSSRSSFYSDDPATATFIFVPFYSGLWTLLCLYSRSLFQDQTLQRAFQRERTSCLTLSDLADEGTQSSFWAQSKGKNFIWISNHVNVRPIPNPSILMTVEKSQEVGNVQLSLVLLTA